MKAEIISTGDEVITGMIDDTNATWLCSELLTLGVQVERRSTCSDDVEEFAKIVIQAAKDAMDEKETGIYRDMFKARIRRSCGCDMRSYMSAGRRAYDLEAARAAGIHVPDGVISTEKKENQTAMKPWCVF